jgi:hypothetical protein
MVQESVSVNTNYKPDFNSIISCNSSGTTATYNVTLVNNTTVFNSAGIVYSFSGPGIPAGSTAQTINLTNMAAGTYNYTLTVNIPGKPTCTITKPITLANVGTPSFSIADTTVCAEEPISVTIANYNPLFTYRWIFFQTSFIASSATTLLNINAPSSGNYGISLEVTTPQGCIFTSAQQSVYVNKASFNGSLQVTPDLNVCEGTPQTITYNLLSGTGPTLITWMKGNLQVGTGTSYVPTASGIYWVKLSNSQGCIYTFTNPVSITIRQRPYAAIVGSSSVCAGTQGTIQGVVTNPALQRRWLLNGNPMVAPYGTWATTTPLTITVPTTPGTYNYTFEVRPASDTSCGSTATISVTVYPAVTPPVISYNVVTCEPYAVQVTASGPSSGIYNWSNGAVGQTITVGHGGALGVTYTATSGCSASSEAVMIPQQLERLLWVFPEGCYDVCYNTSPAPYILGPLGVFDIYKWLRNGLTIATGTNSVVPQLPITQGGAYQLTIQNDGCVLESGIMTLIPNSEECDINGCSFKSDVKEETGFNGSVYLLNGYIQNITGSPITVTLTSFNNYGTYTPGSITIPAYSTYNFAPLQFTPNASFNGGNDIIVLQMPGCMTAYPVIFAETAPGASARLAAMSIAPNPAEGSTVVSYDLGDSYKQAESLTVYTLLGNPVFTAPLDKPAGEVNLSTVGLPSGTYVVSIQADGVKALQKVLVKK